ncbi:RNA polymerase sigma factor, partial [Lacticaseibacillus rhamnosus]
MRASRSTGSARSRMVPSMPTAITACDLPIASACANASCAFAALRRGGPDAPIRPWLFRIAHNEAVSALRRRRPTVELSDATDCWTTSVEDQVADRGRLDLLLCDLRELHDRQRSALVMRELSGLSHEDIALALETSVGAAKQ